MADWGIKVAKVLKDISSNTPTDFNFWTKHQTLPLIYKVQTNFSVNSGSCSGVHSYSHNLGFFPLVIAVVTNLRSISGRYPIPVSYAVDFSKFYCDDGFGGGNNLHEQFTNLKVTTSVAQFDYLIECIIPMVGSSCPPSSITYNIDWYFYMFNLGNTL